MISLHSLLLRCCSSINYPFCPSHHRDIHTSPPSALPLPPSLSLFHHSFPLFLLFLSFIVSSIILSYYTPRPRQPRASDVSRTSASTSPPSSPVSGRPSAHALPPPHMLWSQHASSTSSLPSASQATTPAGFRSVKERTQAYSRDVLSTASPGAAMPMSKGEVRHHDVPIKANSDCSMRSDNAVGGFRTSHIPLSKGITIEKEREILYV